MPLRADLPFASSPTHHQPTNRRWDAASKADWQRFEPRLHVAPRHVAPDGSAIDRFIHTLPRALEDLSVSCERNDGEGVRRTADQIRELAASVGGLRVTTLASQLLSSINESDSHCEQLICELRRASTELHSALLDEH